MYSKYYVPILASMLMVGAIFCLREINFFEEIILIVGIYSKWSSVNN